MRRLNSSYCLSNKAVYEFLKAAGIKVAPVQLREKGILMTYNETITFLKRAVLIDNIIKRKQEEVEELRNLASGIAKTQNSADRVQTSPEHDQVGKIVGKIVDLESELSLEIGLYVDVKKNIIKKIDELESLDQRNVLYMKYLKGRTFEYIAESTGNSLSTIYRLHKKAVKNISKLVDI